MAHEHTLRTPERPSSHLSPLRNAVAVSLPSSPTCVRTSRQFAAEAMERWGGIPAVVAEDALVVVSELVTNAVLHGGEDGAEEVVRLRIEHCGDELTVRVTDGTSKPARLRTAGATETGGRGLLLVMRLADDWGVSEQNHTTWARFSTHPQEQAC
ncbi:ATP-binding protein [Streptomyces sp. NRRL F-5193]|uniref:ATP-binding protein n=1 Tax=Streptomyces sp. NRRL F-5193 TaxID=1463860 RepID=UPI00068EAE51|nr:ATP-binding protein [Streptomyces sp. NRRL F-5193]